MVVNKINVVDLPRFEPKNNPPVCTYRYRMKPGEATAKGVKSVAGKVGGTDRRRVIEHGQYALNLRQKIRSYAASIPTAVEPFEATMPEALDHPAI